MEGVGSRQSRRYASSPSAAAVFNGPVRKWKKQWVSSQANNQSNGNNNRNNNAPPLLLCRWTPLSAAADEPPRRRFRYAPIVPIEKGNIRTLEKYSNEARTTIGNHSNNGGNESGGVLEKASTGYISGEESQGPSDQADSSQGLVHG